MRRRSAATPVRAPTIGGGRAEGEEVSPFRAKAKPEPERLYRAGEPTKWGSRALRAHPEDGAEGVGRWSGEAAKGNGLREVWASSPYSSGYPRQRTRAKRVPVRFSAFRAGATSPEDHTTQLAHTTCHFIVA